MSELKQYDDTIHNEDEYETPIGLFDFLCEEYDIHPKLDVAASPSNTKCEKFLDDSLYLDWNIHEKDVWCNPPHSLTEEFVIKADEQYEKHNINIMMIVPANAICAHYFDEILGVVADYHRISGRIRFLQNGKPSKHTSRNSYFVVLWRKH